MRRLSTTFVTSTLILFLAGSACRDATEPLQPEPLFGLPLTGNIAVTTATSGEELDPDGYTVTVDLLLSQPTPTNGTTTFGGVLTGVHLVQLNGVAGNCSVSGGNPQTVVVLLGGTAGVNFAVSCVGTTPPPPPPPPPPAGVRVTGLGATLPTNERLEFDFDVTDPPAGRMLITWYASYPPPAGVERLTVDPADPATQIASLQRTSATCVQFSGTGRLDITGELKFFVVDVCDNGSPGTGGDTFGILIQSDNWQRLDPLSEGDIVIGGP